MEKEKELFIEPEIEVVLFDNDDIIQTSNAEQIDFASYFGF